MMLEQIVRKQTALRATKSLTVAEYIQLLREDAKPAAAGRVVGLKLAQDIRSRIDGVKVRYGLHTTRNAAIFCILAGLDALKALDEGTKTP
jgi:hypothetical protein